MRGRTASSVVESAASATAQKAERASRRRIEREAMASRAQGGHGWCEKAKGAAASLPRPGVASCELAVRGRGEATSAHRQLGREPKQRGASRGERGSPARVRGRSRRSKHYARRCS